MTSRLGYPVFDGDNHMYETRDALTKFLPPEYHGAIRYVEVDGRTKIATLGQISDYIPNPTFDKVAALEPRRTTSTTATLKESRTARFWGKRSSRPRRSVSPGPVWHCWTNRASTNR